MNRLRNATAAASLAVLMTACGGDRPQFEESADAQGHTAPTAITAERNQQVLKELPFADKQDFEDARRGLIASEPGLLIRTAEGRTVWDMESYAFIEGEAPASVNPSLWRQESLNNIHGLFRVAEGIYQFRGYDLANMTLIEGDTGWIVVDPMTAQETARHAMQFAAKHLGDKPVTAIIFTHSHIDHFGGALGVVDPADVTAGKVQVIAPEGFTEEATSENVLAGVVMARRAAFMYGRNLTRSERGQVGNGLGKAPAYGTIGILEPNVIISQTGQELEVDGVPIQFQYTPESEAPAELTFYLPEQKAFCGAEVVSRTLHNLYTLRGAKVRDALKWSAYIDEAAEMFGEAEVYFASHHWPLWGNERVIDFLEKQRDMYKFIHDQTMRLAMQGMTPREIANTIKLPDSLNDNWATRGYYGTLRHNARAVYQSYFGWYDANPANLNPMAPAESAKRYVHFMGGADQVVANAQKSFDAGEYRWVAEVLNQVVFAEPEHNGAKALLAKAYDQLGYQAESGPWRNVYLTAAYELRHGAPSEGVKLSDAIDMVMHTPIPRFLEAMAVRLKAEEAEGKDTRVLLRFSDLGESYLLKLKNSVLHFQAVEEQPAADATLTLTKEIYVRMAVGVAGIRDTLFSDDLKVDGSKLDLVRFFALFEQPEGTFNIVTP